MMRSERQITNNTTLTFRAQTKAHFPSALREAREITRPTLVFRDNGGHGWSSGDQQVAHDFVSGHRRRAVDRENSPFGLVLLAFAANPD